MSQKGTSGILWIIVGLVSLLVIISSVSIYSDLKKKSENFFGDDMPHLRDGNGNVIKPVPNLPSGDDAASVETSSYLASRDKAKLATPTAEELKTWLTYEDKKLGFSFKYPQNWKISNKTENGNNLTSISDPYFVNGITFNEKYPGTSCSVQYVPLEIIELKLSDGKNYKIQRCAQNSYLFFIYTKKMSQEKIYGDISIQIHSDIGLEHRIILEVLKTLKY